MTPRTGGAGHLPVPPAVLDAVAGQPNVGVWEVMIPLLTVDGDGHPYVCMLSRAELSADRERVYAVVASPLTIENLRRSAAATLITIDDAAATYTKLTLESTHRDGDWMLASFTVAAVKRDSVGTPLQPPRYLVTDTLAVQEDWARGATLLEGARQRLDRSGTPWR